MGRRVVEVEVTLLDVLAVVAFGVGHPEEPLFEKGVASVPQRERDADVLMTIAHPEEAIFVPAVGTGPRVVMGKVFPRRCVTAVVFADRTPCAFGEVRAPPIPVLDAPPRFVKAAPFGRHADVRHRMNRPSGPAVLEHV